MRRDFSEAVDLDGEFPESCYCDTLPVDHFRSVCDVCRLEQLSDFDYVSNWLSSIRED